jgi:hypothetical protein
MEINIGKGIFFDAFSLEYEYNGELLPPNGKNYKTLYITI